MTDSHEPPSSKPPPENPSLPVNLPAYVSQWREPAELLSKGLIALVGVAYIAGLLILNTHVRRYGVTYLNFLQIEYVMVGLLFLLIMGAAVLGCLFIGARLRELWADRYLGKKVILTLLYCVLGIATAVFSVQLALRILAPDQFELLTWKGLLSTGKVLFCGLMIILVLKNIQGYFRKLRSGNKGAAATATSVRFDSYLEILYQALLSLSVIGLYSWYLYPNLPPSYGGGQPQKAQFVVKPDQFGLAPAVGLTMVPGTRVTDPLDIIFEAQDYFLIVPSQGFKDKKVKAIRINKDWVDGALYVSEK